MMIRLRRLLILLPVLLILISGCTALTGSMDYQNKYLIDVYYNPGEASIYTSQELSYKNTEDGELEYIYFHLYPNAFREEETAPMIGSLSQNYPDGFNSGQIDIIKVSVNGKIVNWTVQGEDGTILEVKLRRPVQVNETIDIKMDFLEKLPNARTDFCSYDGIACFENWYPILCVYDKDGWHEEPSFKLGEVNFSEISDYTVNINLPSDEVVASSGKCIKVKDAGGSRKIITLKADNVRDFTWISSSRFKFVERKNGKVTIRSYFLEKDKDKGVAAIEFASRALSLFSEEFGDYPYDTFNVVETPLYGGAMEYPLLTSVGMQYYEYGDIKFLEGAVAHEAAHQWWYVVVGNNEYEEPWLDESLATYSEAVYYEKYYGREVMKNRIDMRAELFNFDRATTDSLDQFRSLDEYNAIVYLKGAYILDQFRERVGDDKFFEAMQSYYKKYKFTNASSNDFFGIINEVCGNEDVEYIKSRLMETK